MGREYRTIAITAEEFSAAVRDYCARQKTIRSDSRNIIDIALSEGPEITCEVEFQEPLLDARKRITLPPQEVIELIIAYVGKLGHPLPRRGRKSLTWIEGEIALLIELDWF